MTTKRILGAAVAGVIVAVAGVAVAANFSSSARTDFYAPGKHQFYVWCGNGNDHLAYERGTSGQDALNKLSDAENASGNAHCRPVWQGRVLS